MRKAFILIGLLASCGVSNGQTIHINDFDYFIGCFERTDPLDRESIDCSEFVEWHIINPEADGIKRDLSSIEYSKDKHWVYDWEPLSTQHRSFAGSRYRQSSRGFQFYILMDFFGHERMVNVLTAWERIGKDSLRYHCGQVGGFDSFIGSSRIERVKTFPDNSILLVVKSGGEGYQGYSFFRGSPECNFQSFYKKQWGIPYNEGENSYTSTHYNLEHMRRSSYKAIEVSEFITTNKDDLDFQISVDSAKVKIIDLWDMAKKTFGLESK